MDATTPSSDSAGSLCQSFRLPHWTLCLLATISLIFVVVAGLDVLETKRIRDTKSRGSQVVSAIERFRADNGRYPEPLMEIAPKYIPVILQPAWGLKQWRYATKNDAFSLTVDESAKSVDGDAHRLEFSARDRIWHLAD